MTVGIIGAGNMGRALSRRCATAGEAVILADKDRSKAEAVASDVSQGVSGRADASDVESALADGDPVILAVFYPAGVQLATANAAALKGKVVVDIANPLNADYSDLAEGVSTTRGSSAAEEIATAAPGARVVKAFNTVFAPVLYEGGAGNQPADVLVAGDDAAAKESLSALVTAAGMRPIDAGPLSRARELERLGMLHIGLQMPHGWNFQTMLKLHTPS